MRLRAEMRLPGKGWLEFRGEPEAGNETRLQQIAYFQPKVLFGLVCWYMLYPIHRFKGLVQDVARRAEEHG